MSDLGNGGWPNSMKLGEDIDLDDLYLNPVFFWLRSIFLSLFQGDPILGSQSPKKHPHER